jgi:hypothetical protein
VLKDFLASVGGGRTIYEITRKERKFKIFFVLVSYEFVDIFGFSTAY